jgi:hypothetical protein
MSPRSKAQTCLRTPKKAATGDPKDMPGEPKDADGHAWARQGYFHNQLYRSHLRAKQPFRETLYVWGARFGLRQHDTAFRRGDVSPGSKASRVRDLRTPKKCQRTGPPHGRSTSAQNLLTKSLMSNREDTNQSGYALCLFSHLPGPSARNIRASPEIL